MEETLADRWQQQRKFVHDLSQEICSRARASQETEKVFLIDLAKHFLDLLKNDQQLHEVLESRDPAGKLALEIYFKICDFANLRSEVDYLVWKMFHEVISLLCNWVILEHFRDLTRVPHVVAGETAKTHGR